MNYPTQYDYYPTPFGEMLRLATEVRGNDNDKAQTLKRRPRQRESGYGWAYEETVLDGIYNSGDVVWTHVRKKKLRIG